MSTASQFRPADAWIRSPGYDLFFFSAWWAPITLWIYLKIPSLIAAAILFTAYHLLLRLPHFAATAQVTFLNPQQRRYFNRHWIRFYIVPGAILLLYTLPSILELPRPLHQGMISLFMIWGAQHLAMQNYGIMSIYRSRLGAGAAAQRFDPLLERSCFYLLCVSACLESAAYLWVSFPQRWIELSSSAFRSAALLLAAFYLLWKVGLLLWKKTPVSVPGMIYFLSAVGTFAYWPFYHSLGYLQGYVLYFYISNAHHSLTYLGLVHFMSQNQKSPDLLAPARLEGGRAGAVVSFLGFFLPLLLVAALGVILVLGTPFPGPEALLAGSTFRAYECLLGVFVAHYYIEALCWKFSNPEARRNLLPLIARRERVEAYGVGSASSFLSQKQCSISGSSANSMTMRSTPTAMPPLGGSPSSKA